MTPPMPDDRRAAPGGAARPPAPLDRLDREILACLREDGRMANSEIARRLGVGEKTIRRRLQRLTDERGRKVIVPANLVAYVEIAQADTRRVGFAG